MKFLTGRFRVFLLLSKQLAYNTPSIPVCQQLFPIFFDFLFLCETCLFDNYFLWFSWYLYTRPRAFSRMTIYRNKGFADYVQFPLPMPLSKYEYTIIYSIQGGSPLFPLCFMVSAVTITCVSRPPVCKILQFVIAIFVEIWYYYVYSILSVYVRMHSVCVPSETVFTRRTHHDTAE